MELAENDILEKTWLQELLIFGTSFILITLNSFTSITTLSGLVKALIYFFVLFIHVQLHRFVLLPFFQKNKKYVLYGLTTICFILLFSAILTEIDTYWIVMKFGSLRFNKIDSYFYHIGTCSLSLIAMAAPFFLLSFYREQKKQASLQLAVNQLQLKMLYSQLNPHFLFNTFNNLYGISLNDPSRVSDLILQVSNLMRYQLENNSRDWAKLEDELAFIEAYIGLEDERIGNRCDIRYDYRNDTGYTNYAIAPLLLMTFIENAFKHGTDTISRSFVYINISIKNSVFVIEVINSISSNQKENERLSGTGLKNALQRLKILYGNKYILKEITDEDKHIVSLTLPLTEYNNVSQNQMPNS